jgi:hypothetical protein
VHDADTGKPHDLTCPKATTAEREAAEALQEAESARPESAAILPNGSELRSALTESDSLALTGEYVKAYHALRAGVLGMLAKEQTNGKPAE